MPEKTPEQQAAEIVDKLNGLFEGDDSLPKTIDRVKALQKELEEIKGLDLKNICEEFDKLKAGQDKIRKAIKSNRHSRGYVAGLEDEDEQNFSMIRALTAIGTKNWGKAGYEKEVMDAAKAAANKSQNIGDDSAGGYFVPDQVIPDVVEAIYTQSALLALDAGSGQTRVSVLDGLTGMPVTIPKFEGGTIAYWIGEEDSIAESAATVGNLSMTPKQMGVLVRLTDAMRRFGGFGFENLLRNDIVRAAAKKIDWTILYGSGGDHTPRGLVNHPDINVSLIGDSSTRQIFTQAQVVTAADPLDDIDGSELDFDDMDDMLLHLEEDDIAQESSFAWISSPRFFRRLRRQKVIHFTGQTVEQAYLLGTPMITDAQLAGAIGSYGKSNQIPTTNKPGESVGGTTDSTVEKHTDVFVGNWSECLFGRWGGLEVSDDAARGADFASGHLNMKLIMYSDVAIRQPRAFLIAADVKVRD